MCHAEQDMRNDFVTEAHSDEEEVSGVRYLEMAEREKYDFY